MRYFYNAENGKVVALNAGNRLLELVELFQVDPQEKTFEKAAGGGSASEKGPETSEKAPPQAGEPGNDLVAVRKPKSPYKGKKSPKNPRGTKGWKGGHKCGKCGEYGHNKATCKFSIEEKPSQNAEEALEQMRFTPITPDKLMKIKSMLKDGEPVAFIATEAGVSEERVEKMKAQLGL